MREELLQAREALLNSRADINQVLDPALKKVAGLWDMLQDLNRRADGLIDQALAVRGQAEAEGEDELMKEVIGELEKLGKDWVGRARDMEVVGAPFLRQMRITNGTIGV